MSSSPPTEQHVSEQTSPTQLTKKEKKQKKKITKKHPEFELTYDMMLGIRTTVSRHEASVRKDQELSTFQFRESDHMRFPKRGTHLTPAHQMRDFKFKDYAPEVFCRLRKRFKIDPMDYLLRLCGDFAFLEFISNSKSGQFFFYTHDRQYMIKTQTKDESKFLRKILPAYYKYVINEPNTLLTRYFGMHRVKPHKRQPMYFLIMGSVFYTDKYIHEVYDLKGSTCGREATQEEKQQPVPVLKDMDFVKNNKKLELGKELSKTFMQQLGRDCKFLEKLKIMDYSLLLGIHYTDRDAPDSYLTKAELKKLKKQEKSAGKIKKSSDANLSVRSSSHQNNLQEVKTENMTEDEQAFQDMRAARQSVYGLKKKEKITSPNDYGPTFKNTAQTIEEVKHDEIANEPLKEQLSIFNQHHGGVQAKDVIDEEIGEMYFMGIIDVLQKYNTKKQMEHVIKSIQYDSRTISAVNPTDYGHRLVDFLQDKVK